MKETKNPSSTNRLHIKAVEHNLLLWQIAESYIKVEKKIANSLAGE